MFADQDADEAVEIEKVSICVTSWLIYLELSYFRFDQNSVEIRMPSLG